MKNVSRYLRDQLLLAQHHLNDAETAPNKQVLESSIGDAEEMVQRMATVLPPEDKVSVKAEQLRKDAALAAASNPCKVSTMNHQELLKRAAEAETIDRANAFEIGFAKAAQAAGLDETAYNEMRAFGIQYLKKHAATAPGETKAQPETNALGVAKAVESPQQEVRETKTKKAEKPTPGKKADEITPGKGCK